MLASRRSTLRPALALITTVLVLVVSGCGGDGADSMGADPVATTGTDTSVTRAQPAGVTLQPGDDVPPPSGEVVIVVRGGTTTNVGDELRLDLAQLDALEQVEYDADDYLATGEVATFSGPLVRTVLQLAGAEGTTMHTAALNDYLVDVPVSDATSLPLMLATRMDGRPMSVANYGPTRFIYPTQGYGLDPVTYDPRWIWQLRSIEVE